MRGKGGRRGQCGSALCAPSHALAQLTLTLTLLHAHPTPRPCRELWALADFLTALSSTEDVREGLGMWAAGTYRGPQSLRRRDPSARAAALESDGEDE